MRIKSKLLILLLMVGVMQTGWCFTPLGPFKPWQVPRIGYRLPGQIGGPMLAIEAYRWNVPVITYAFDSTFVRYFGTNGINAVRDAIKMFQDLPPVDSI